MMGADDEVIGEEGGVHDMQGQDSPYLGSACGALGAVIILDMEDHS